MKKEQILSYDEAHRQKGESIKIVGQFEINRPVMHGKKRAAFSTHLLKRFDGTFPVRALEIGVFEGMGLVWLMQNCLKHPDSVAIGVDPWDWVDGREGCEANAVHFRAVRNLSGFSNAQLIWGKSQDVLPTLDSESFDLVIVDGSHKTEAVHADAIEARRLVKQGGWIVLDDIRHWNGRARKDRGPARAGLERFLDEYGDEFDQAWSMGPCECLEKR